MLHKYDKLFTDKLSPDPIKTDIKFDIQTTTETPVRVAPYRVPLKKQQLVKEHIKEMLAAGIIKPGESEYSAPIHLVPKADGKTRLVCDYTMLNKITKVDPFPLINIQEIFDNLSNKSYFTVVDAISGYFQVGLTKEAQRKTAIVCQQGQFLFNRLPMGLRNSPGCFNRVMTSILHDFIGDFLYIYMDDIVIFSDTMEDHLVHLDKVFKRLMDHNVQLKRSKCTIATDKV